MISRFLLLFCFTASLLMFNNASAQNISNEGADFWLAFPTHDPSGEQNLANINVFVTCKFNSKVTVSCGATYSETKNIIANTVVAFNIPRELSYIDRAEGNTILTNRAIHVVTEPGQPKVAVYAHIYAGRRSAASLILPTGALGKEYYAMSYNQENEGDNFLMLVATEDNTTLLLHDLSGNETKIVLPKAGDVYQYLVPQKDLTGVHVEVDPLTSSCKKFAAFSGSTAVVIECGQSADPLFQQLYSTSNWGKSYGVVPFINRTYLLRILAQTNGTNVEINGLKLTLNKGQFYETKLTEPALVTADKLISVAQYALSQNCASDFDPLALGDPEMVLLNPIEFNIKNITLFSSDNQDIQEKYINVFMKTDKTSTFKVNGIAPSNGIWQMLPFNPTYSFIQIRVFEESLSLTAADGFNAIAYGFGDFESYAYSAGTNLTTSEFLMLVNSVTKKETTSACINEPVDFKLTVPFPLTSIVWKVGEGTPDFLDQNPVATTTIVNGDTFYTYYSPVKNKAYKTIGEKVITVLATLNPAVGACANSALEFNFGIVVYPQPETKFEVQTIKCAGRETAFTDKSNSGLINYPITKWSWDFGDPNSGSNNVSAEQHPKHQFTQPGQYIVKLYSGTEEGCTLGYTEQTITINPTPIAVITGPSKTCVGTSITFKDQSTTSSGTIIKYTWDFGDQSPLAYTPVVSHAYQKDGSYIVKLTVETADGCTSDVFPFPVTVNKLPTAQFELPAVCLSDAKALFKNLSLDADGGTNGMTYLWNFGDPNSGALNTSTDPHGSHKYSTADNYIVTLKITDKNGCEDIVTHPFTVNGILPEPSFEFPTTNCSNQTFTVKNTSTVLDFGKITRLEWYLDNIPAGADDNPTQGKTYQLNYPAFSQPAYKTVPIKLIAFSGSVDGQCRKEKIEYITLYPSPIVKFDDIDPVCIDKRDFQLIASETGGVTGDGFFSGTGVNKSGRFSPLIAKVGTHQITYTFTTDKGCTDTKTISIKVNPLPTVNAGAGFYLLAGHEKRLEATASGKNLTYSWSPGDGLSNPTILNPIAKPAIDTKYTLTVTSADGCTAVDEVDIRVLQEVIAPNTFTPNGDGVNDVWNVKYLDTYPNATLEIFNRYGNRVFFSKGYPVPFDGTSGNSILPVGVYYYIISPNSGRKRMTGSLTIIR